RGTADPALFVRVAATMLRVEPDAPLAAEASASIGRILGAVSNPQLRRSFEDSEPVRFIHSVGRPHARGREPRSEYPAGLSDREVEVLRLVAAGKSNTRIAA